MIAERDVRAGLRSEFRPGRPLIGPIFLLPGAPQWLWLQRERALLLFGSFATSLGVGLFAWGTQIGLALLVFAYITHVVSAADAIRQWSFPGFSRWIPTCSASACLAVGFYGPLLLFGSTFAWPGLQGMANAEGYLVNRLAYQSLGPEAGDRIWLRGGGGTGGSLAEVVAKPGQSVEWNNRGLKINGRSVPLVPFRQGEAPLDLKLQVPEGRLLVAFQTGDPYVSKLWEFVPVARVEGRAWAKLYPIWDRCLLP